MHCWSSGDNFSNQPHEKLLAWDMLLILTEWDWEALYRLLGKIGYDQSCVVSKAHILYESDTSSTRRCLSVGPTKKRQEKQTAILERRVVIELLTKLNERCNTRWDWVLVPDNRSYTYDLPGMGQTETIYHKKKVTKVTFSGYFSYTDFHWCFIVKSI